MSDYGTHKKNNIYIMKITLYRRIIKGEYAEGVMSVGGKEVCDTLENAYTCLPKGEYRLELKKCKHYEHRMVLVGKEQLKEEPKAQPDEGAETQQEGTTASITAKNDRRCRICPRLDNVNQNTVLQKYCPMIKQGNGVHNRHDGSILVGKRGALGLLINTEDAYEALFERLRKTVKRGAGVTLEIL